MLPDPSTFRALPWAPHTGWMLCDIVFADGRPVPLDTRHLYRRALISLGEAGYDFVPISAGLLAVAGVLSGEATVTKAHQYSVYTEAEREVGLMGRTALDADAGMVFLFDGTTTASFWMKDTLIPLSIAFWGTDGRIVGILDMEPCEADPCPTFNPGVPYVGALEANLASFADRGVAVGDTVRLEGAP